ncbi:MAG: ArdC-like ssDNA-binding domain-containing protein [Lachnospiraceae bacterium]|nr:ArdC-like ssDNA-binding domain-containing protein [Lachnospiraceae bacterium]
MTNTEIIIREAIKKGLYTEKEVNELIARGYTVPLHTYTEWINMGCQVSKGEKAKIETKLWKFTNKKTKGDKPDEEKAYNHYYLAKAFLFDASQVEGIKSN